MKTLDWLSSGRKAWFILFAITLTAAGPGVFNLPALDRDESRFAQASKQYIETGDYIVIRYQDEFRNKKPAGIHWLQSGATLALGDEDRLDIWTYRVPSWLGAAFSTLAVFWAGIVLVGRRAAFLGSALYGATLLLTSEAHISKTDGVLVFLTAWGIGALARLYVRGDQSKSMAILFWAIMGASFLIKGPVTMMVAAYAGFGAWVWAKAGEGKGGDWWKPLAWWPGPVLCAAIILPWFISIQLATDGQYIQGAVGKDLKDKFAGASEGHAGWPVYHLTHIPAWFFPATLLLLPGAVLAWQKLRGVSDEARKRGTDAALIFLALGAVTALASWILPGELGNGAPSAYPALIIVGFWLVAMQPAWFARWPQETLPDDETKALRFLTAWAVLTWIFFELMPTRLSHYILPAYPAFALICGWIGVKMMDGRRFRAAHWLSLVLFAIGGGALLLLSSPLAVDLLQIEAAGDFKTVEGDIVLSEWSGDKGFPLWLWVLGGLALIAALAAFAARRIGTAVTASILTSMLFGWHARIYFLPTQTWFQPTESARLALEQVCGLPAEICADGTQSPQRILAVGYAEPSYVMTFGTQNLHPPETTIGLPSDDAAYPVVYLLNLENEDSRKALSQLTDEARRQGRCLSTSNPVYALNYSNGDPVHFIATRFEATPCEALS
ncbi:MAG: glycosyltransferase family 39 protein [Pseudomonadota bacterium]